VRGLDVTVGLRRLLYETAGFLPGGVALLLVHINRDEHAELVDAVRGEARVHVALGGEVCMLVAEPLDDVARGRQPGRLVQPGPVAVWFAATPNRPRPSRIAACKKLGNRWAPTCSSAMVSTPLEP